MALVDAVVLWCCSSVLFSTSWWFASAHPGIFPIPSGLIIGQQDPGAHLMPPN